MSQQFHQSSLLTVVVVVFCWDLLFGSWPQPSISFFAFWLWFCMVSNQWFLSRCRHCSRALPPLSPLLSPGRFPSCVPIRDLSVWTLHVLPASATTVQWLSLLCVLGLMSTHWQQPSTQCLLLLFFICCFGQCWIGYWLFLWAWILNLDIKSPVCKDTVQSNYESKQRRLFTFISFMVLYLIAALFSNTCNENH